MGRPPERERDDTEPRRTTPARPGGCRTGTPRRGRAMSNEERDDAHLADIEEGAGCTEIWEHLSEKREREEAD
ncbi:hypothetical protein [Halalkalicoccus paucihalophilus]